MSLLSATLLTLTLVITPQAQGADQRAEAQRLAQSGEHARALQQFQAIAAANPDDLEVRLWIARLHGLMGRPERAVDVYRSILAVAPQNVDALVGLGNDLTTIGRFTDAADVLNRAEAIAADRPSVLAAQGRLHGAAGRGGLAVAYYQRALALDTTNAAIRDAYDTLRAERAHRVEGSYYFEHFYDAGTSDTHSGIVEVNGRVNDALRLFGVGQYQRKFDRDEERAGGGFEWASHGSTWLRVSGLFANDTVVLPDADAAADFSYTHKKLTWLASARYLHFDADSSTVWSPGVTIAPNQTVTLTLRYYRSRSILGGFSEVTWNDGLTAGVSARADRRLVLSAGYSRGWEGLTSVTSDRFTASDANTLTAGVRFDAAPMSALGATFEHQWREDDVRVATLLLTFVQRF